MKSIDTRNQPKVEEMGIITYVILGAILVPAPVTSSLG